MYMKRHVLAALREEFDEWQKLLAELDEAQITTPQPSSGWSIKDEVAHLWAWQQRSLARMEAATLDREPKFPEWPSLDGDEEATNRINEWLYNASRDRPWPEVRQSWQEVFQRILALAEQISERDLLDSERYAWMEEYPLIFTLMGTYDHHQEHLEKLLDRMQRGA